jgi:hypothetical protein
MTLLASADQRQGGGAGRWLPAGLALLRRCRYLAVARLSHSCDGNVASSKVSGCYKREGTGRSRGRETETWDGMGRNGTQ